LNTLSTTTSAIVATAIPPTETAEITLTAEWDLCEKR
jgi:hypothetical protein